MELSKVSKPEEVTYAQMKLYHGLQIEALLKEDFEAFEEALNLEENETPDRVTDHFSAWENTGRHDCSLFASLPGQQLCLTQLKLNETESRARGGNYLLNKLGLMENNLIPCVVEHNVKLTREQLEEFSRLQLLARFPESV